MEDVDAEDQPVALVNVEVPQGEVVGRVQRPVSNSVQVRVTAPRAPETEVVDGGDDTHDTNTALVGVEGDLVGSFAPRDDYARLMLREPLDPAVPNRRQRGLPEGPGVFPCL